MIYRPDFFEEVTVQGKEEALRRLRDYISNRATSAERLRLQRQLKRKEFELEVVRGQEERNRRKHNKSNGGRW